MDVLEADREYELAGYTDTSVGRIVLMTIAIMKIAIDSGAKCVLFRVFESQRVEVSFFYEDDKVPIVLRFELGTASTEKVNVADIVVRRYLRWSGIGNARPRSTRSREAMLYTPEGGRLVNVTYNPPLRGITDENITVDLAA